MSFPDREKAIQALRSAILRRYGLDASEVWASVTVDAVLAALSPAEPVQEGCPDGGTCHHDCAERYSGACWRVFLAAPLSAAGWGREWPQEVKDQQHKKMGLRPEPVPATDPVRAAATEIRAEDLREVRETLIGLQSKNYGSASEVQGAIEAFDRIAAALAAEQ